MSRKNTDYEIDLVHQQDNEEADYAYRIGLEFFRARENEEILGSDVEVHLKVRRHHDIYDLEFSFDGFLEVPCDRCLDPVKVEVGEDYDARLKYGEEYDDMSEDDVITLPYGTTRYDVSGLIYDTLMLAIPIRCVHPDGECNAEMTAALDEHREENEEL